MDHDPEHEGKSKDARPVTTTRRRLLAAGAAAGAMVWMGPQLGWQTAAHAATPPSKPTGKIVIGFSQEPVVFMPLLSHIEVDQGLYFNLFSALWRVGPKGAFEPDLVAEMPTLENGGISSDGTHWHLKLNKKARWHDGKPFTAEDVKYNIELIQNPHFAAGRRSGIELIENIKILNPHELTFDLKKPYAPLAAILSWTFLVPKHLMEKAKDPNKPVQFLAHPIGTGPFKWKNRVAGDHITLSANTDYHGAGPYVEELIFKYIPDLTVLYTQFRTGTIDYIGIQGISPTHYAQAIKLPGRVVEASPQPFVENIAFNLGLKVFQDRAVRQALYYAMDKHSIIKTVYYGLPTETESFLPRQNWAYNPNLPKHEYSIEKAKKTLEDAGWKVGSGGVREKDGVRLEFRNSTTAGNHVREQTQQFLQQTWMEIGAKMTIKNYPPAVMWGDNWTMSKFDTAMVGLDFMVGPDPDSTQYFSSKAIPAQGGGGANTTQYANPEVDKLLAAGASTVDRAKRKADYMKMQEIVHHDLPYLPIFQYAMVQGVKKGLTGFEPNVNVEENCWNANTWYWSS